MCPKFQPFDNGLGNRLRRATLEEAGMRAGDFAEHRNIAPPGSTACFTVVLCIFREPSLADLPGRDRSKLFFDGKKRVRSEHSGPVVRQHFDGNHVMLIKSCEDDVHGQVMHFKAMRIAF